MGALTLLDLSEAKINAARSIENINPLSSPAENFADLFVGLKTSSGKMVTRETAMRASAVLSCIRILTEDISTLPLILKRKTAQGAADATNSPLYDLLKTSPNFLQTSVDVREHLLMDMLLSGRAAAWIRRVNGVPVEIWPLRAQDLTVSRQAANGQYVWAYSGIDIQRTEFAETDLWRCQMLSRSLFGEGQALTLLAREAIGLALAAEEQGARLFAHGIQTDVVFQTTATLDEAGKTELRDALTQRYSGSQNSWRPLLLENGMTVSKIGLTAQESQYIESRAYQLADVARIFRIPGVMVGINDKSSTYASAEQFFLAYVKHTVQPWIVRLEQSLQRDVLRNTKNLFFKHDLSSLLRADQKTRYDSYAVAITNGFLNPNECRAMEDREEVDGLDLYLRPLNMTPIGPDGKSLEPPQPAPGAPGTPGKPETPTKEGARPAKEIAEITANHIIAGENRVFLREIRAAALVNKPRKAEKLASFFTYHAVTVASSTGCTLEEATEYCAMRCAQEDPLSEISVKQAEQGLINLTLGVKPWTN